MFPISVHCALYRFMGDKGISVIFCDDFFWSLLLCEINNMQYNVAPYCRKDCRIGLAKFPQ